MGLSDLNLTRAGHLSAGTDIAAVLRTGDEAELHAVWDTYHFRRLLTDTLAKLDAGTLASNSQLSIAERRAALATSIAELATITPAQALEANRRLVDLLTGRRWSVMRDAREARDSWTVIGDALDMTKQGALDWYKRKIADQEKHLPNFHDTDRARAVLDES